MKWGVVSKLFELVLFVGWLKLGRVRNNFDKRLDF